MWWRAASARCGWWPTRPAWRATAWTWRPLAQAIEVSNVNLPAGHFSRQDREYLVEAGPFLKSADEVANLLVGLNQGKPVYLKDVAEVIDGPEEPVD